MDKSLAGILAGIVNRRVTWTDKRGNKRFGALREVRGDHVLVSVDSFGSTPSSHIRVPINDVEFVEAREDTDPAYVTYSVWKDTSYVWHWEIKIDNEVWRKRRGFKSHQTANQSLQNNLFEAEEAARNLHPSAEAMAANYLWRAEWERSGLGPADFHDRLSARRKQICKDFVREMARVS